MDYYITKHVVIYFIPNDFCSWTRVNIQACILKGSDDMSTNAPWGSQVNHVVQNIMEILSNKMALWRIIKTIYNTIFYVWITKSKICYPNIISDKVDSFTYMCVFICIKLSNSKHVLRTTILYSQIGIGNDETYRGFDWATCLKLPVNDVVVVAHSNNCSYHQVHFRSAFCELWEANTNVNI